MLVKTKVLEIINDLPFFFSVEELFEILKKAENQNIEKETKSKAKNHRSCEDIEQKIMTEGKVI